MAEFKINEFGEIVRDNGSEKNDDPLWIEYTRLEYEVLNNHHHPTKDPIKIARYNELKKYFDIKKSERAFNAAKEKIKQRIIASDKSSDNSVLYTAMTKFKKLNE